jgi:hypothetical protein
MHDFVLGSHVWNSVHWYTHCGGFWLASHVSQPPHSPPHGSPPPPPVVHGPQSCGHVTHVSLPLQVPSPHAGGHAPQSCGQLTQFSERLHIPSPQTMAGPQLQLWPQVPPQIHSPLQSGGFGGDDGQQH